MSWQPISDLLLSVDPLRPRAWERTAFPEHIEAASFIFSPEPLRLGPPRFAGNGDQYHQDLCSLVLMTSSSCLRYKDSPTVNPWNNFASLSPRANICFIVRENIFVPRSRPRESTDVNITSSPRSIRTSIADSRIITRDT
ncbi:hypothetical protein BDV23DRAFT_48646 [Aspergillus alliaceus]|uniref:Uncharacterized protein n=1 Tax=Petromyces alliaceus TaxID=209559 RepID=A0A5N7CGK4_PETAA|nr:hypothetical protein BDV23DRAFT_48646 [Aspergillus alliaceus]